MPVFFGGQLLTTPTTASTINDDAMQNLNPAVGNAVVYLGRARGGKPMSLLAFSSPEDAIRTLRGGELMDAVVRAFDPSPQTGSPRTVYAVRVSNATQSRLTLRDEAGANVIELVSRNYGLDDNQLKAKVEDGTLRGRRITVQRGGEYFTGDNLAQEVMSVTYDGAGVATLDVALGAVTLSVDGAAVATIDLEEFPTVDTVTSYIGTVEGFNARVLGNQEGHPTLNALDALDGAVLGAEALVVTAHLQAAINWINRSGQDLVTAVRAGFGTMPRKHGFLAFAGGTNGTATIEDWQAAFDVLQHANVAMVTPLSGEPAIHAMTDTHVAFCSNVLRRERRAICGTALGTSFTEAKDAARNINSDRTSLAFQGHYQYDTRGRLELRPAYMSAALAAAMFAAVNPGTPLTNKAIKCQGLEFDLRNPADTDELLEAGLFCFESTEQGYKIVQSITTWLVDGKYTRREQSTGIALDYAVRAVREAVDVLRGEKANPLLLGRAISLAEGTLKECARPEPEGVGVLAGDEANPPFRNIQATIEGDVTRVTFECSPVVPNNYNLVTVYAAPYSGSATA